MVEASPLLLRQVRVLGGPGEPSRLADVLLQGQELLAIDAAAHQACAALAVAPPVFDGEGECWLAPPLVDPHSLLEDPFTAGRESLASLAAAAVRGGYGTVALLPAAQPWRDRPERLQLRWPDPLDLRLWGSFSLEGQHQELAPHGDQLAAGAVGIAAGEQLPPALLLERGLALAEMDQAPVLLAPRDPSLVAQGFVRERVEALRAGWPLDPVLSETLPLTVLLTLAAAHPHRQLRLMNLSTAEGVALLMRQAASLPTPPLASVCWWHLLADSGSLTPQATGWRVRPSLGGPSDRQALIEALEKGWIQAVAIHHRALDPEEHLLPLDQRRPGLAGHGVALSLLWQELVARRGWTVEALWQVLCWGPAVFLQLEPPRLQAGSRRWILVDPRCRWRWEPSTCPSQAANQPVWQETVQGRVVASGLTGPEAWCLPGIPSP